MRYHCRTYQVFGSKEIANSPACGIECLANGANCKRMSCYCGPESAGANKWAMIAEMFVDFVGEKDERVFDAHFA